MTWWNKPEDSVNLEDTDVALPVLTEVVESPEADAKAREQQLDELRADLTTRTYDLTDQLVHTAFRDMEAALFEQLANRLREELPGLVDQVLREHLTDEHEHDQDHDHDHD